MRNIIIFSLALMLLWVGVCFADGWERTYGGSDEDEAYSIQQTVDGGYIIAGETESFGAGYYDVYLVKTDSLGLDERAAQKPQALTLTAFPNSFNSSVKITISTPSVSPPYQGGDVGTIPINRDRWADIAIYDLRGECGISIIPSIL